MAMHGVVIKDFIHMVNVFSSIKVTTLSGDMVSSLTVKISLCTGELPFVWGSSVEVGRLFSFVCSCDYFVYLIIIYYLIIDFRALNTN